MLEEVKQALKITWNDEDINLNTIIERGKNRLQNLTGTVMDFDLNFQARELLINFCRYDYNNSAEYFEENFQKEILRLQLMEGVNALEV